MADQKVRIEIVLDDGSVVRGFANVRGEAKKLGDDLKKNDSVGGALKDAFDGTPVGRFATRLQGLAVPLAALAGSALAVKISFDQALRGERLIELESQFNTLSSQAGIFGPALKGSLQQASGGLVDVNDLLKTANSAFINLGSSAERLPEILDLSRRASAVLGGDVKVRFDGIVQAIESGNVKALRQQGIILDVNRVYRDFAKTLGVTAGSLDLNQRQQAVLNATLEQGRERFKQTDGELTPLKNNLDRITVSLSAIADQTAKTFNAKFGSVYQSVTGAIADTLDRFAPAEETVFTVTKRIDALKLKLEESTVKWAELGEASGTALGTALKREIDDRSNQLDMLRIKLDDLRKAQVRGSQGGAPPPAARNDEQIAQEAALQAELLRLKNEAAKTELANDLAALEGIRQNDVLRLEAERLLTEQLKLLDSERLVAIQEAERKFIDGTAAEKQALLAVDQTFQNRRVQITNDAIKKVQALEDANRAREYQATGTALTQIATLSENSNKELAAIGKAAALTKATIDGYAAVQSAYKDVPFPYNFAAAALVGVAAAANIAKIAATGPGGGSSAFSPATGTGGGITETPTSGTNDFVANQEEREVDTSVVVNIRGDVLDSEDSGLRIVNIINDAFDKKGVTIRRGLVTDGA